MKPQFLLYPSILILLVLSCTKQENGHLNIKTPTTDTTKVLDSLTTKLYPNVDTFIGSLVISYRDQNGARQSIDSVYKFCVKHINKDSLAFIGSTMFPIDGDDHGRFKVMNVWDTGILNSNNACSGNFYTYNTFPVGKEKEVVMFAGLYTFKLTGNNLSVSWDDPWVTIPTCDYGESKGQYNGILKK